MNRIDSGSRSLSSKIETLACAPTSSTNLLFEDEESRKSFKEKLIRDQKEIYS